MSRRPSARPYAKALFEVAVAAGRAEEIGQELATLVGAVTSHAELTKALTHPTVPARAKRQMIEQVAALGELSQPVLRLLSLMADRDRLELLPQLNEAYRDRLRQHLGIVEAHVTTAVPLAPERAAAVAKGLERATGKQVRLTTAVDPSIVGGVIARLGSKEFDGSIDRQLERLRERLVSER